MTLGCTCLVSTLEVKINEVLSNFAFNFDLRDYNEELKRALGVEFYISA